MTPGAAVGGGRGDGGYAPAAGHPSFERAASTIEPPETRL